MTEPEISTGMQAESNQVVTEIEAQPKKVVPVAEARPLAPAHPIGGRVQLSSNVSADTLSKLLAIGFVFFYLSGFLITSLHNFQYGFSEMDPLRPRVLAAGGWFAIFLAVPFALVWELRKHSAFGKKNALNKSAALVVAYVASIAWLIWLISTSVGLFSFDEASTASSLASTPWWGILLLLICGLITGFASRSFLEDRLPQWVSPVAILLFYGYIIFSAYKSLFISHSFKSNAMFFWIFLVGGFAYFEFSQRDWMLTVGQWYRTLIGIFVMLTFFATIYYPHIKAKWGGGAVIPVELTFSKDVPVLSGVEVDFSLIDETDAGFYVIGRGDASATFIPRSEITSIYYGQGNPHSVFAKGLPQKAQSVPPNSPPPAGPAPNSPTPGLSTIKQPTSSHQPVSPVAQRKTARADGK